MHRWNHSNLTPRYVLEEKKAVPEADVDAWADWMDVANRQVAFDHWPAEDIGVLTLFLGLDYDTTGKRPQLFETVVVTPYGGDLYWRYSTWDEAEKGHERIVRIVRWRLKKMGAQGHIAHAR